MKIDLENKIALVADASNDIGKAICVQLVESGARVVGLVRNEDDISQTRAFFRKTAQDVTIYAADATVFDSCKKTIQKIEADIGSIDIVINNSDFIATSNFREMSQKQWADSMNINLDGTYNLCRLISEGMTERGFGRIINISSMYGRKGAAGQSAYATSKSAMHGFTMALAQEVARKGVTVNTVSPGHIKVTAVKNLSTAKANSLVAEIPASRFGEAEEVASLVDFLCSKQAGFITGTDIAINGGQYIH